MILIALLVALWPVYVAAFVAVLVRKSERRSPAALEGRPPSPRTGGATAARWSRRHRAAEVRNERSRETWL